MDRHIPCGRPDLMPSPLPSPSPHDGSARARAWVGPALLAVVVAASRAPFLAPGYGTDTDAWKLAYAARFIGTHGRYLFSRLPGFPIPEVVSGLVWKGGPLALNALTAFFSVLATMLLFFAARRLGFRHPGLTALAFAFTPAVFIGSVSSMDYLWAAAFLLGALLLAADGRAVAAGLALGLATGSRITSAVFLPPLALVLASRARKPRARSMAVMAITAALTGAACYLPAYLAYGLRFLSYYELQGPQKSVVEFLAGMLHPAPGPLPPIFVAGQATVGVFGLLGGVAVGACALAALLAFARRAGGRDARFPAPGPLLPAALVLGVVLPLLLYIRLPSDEGYLIPALPFLLLLLAAGSTPRFFQAMCLVLVASPFLFGMDAVPPKKGVSPRDRSPGAMEFQIGRETMVLEPLRGPLLMDDAKRRRAMALLPRALEELAHLPSGGLLLAGQLEIALYYSAPDDRGHPRYWDYLHRDELEAYLARGATVVYLPDVRLRTLRFAHYDLRDTRARPLFSDQDGPPGPAPAGARTTP